MLTPLTLWRRDDAATEMLCVQSGMVRLEEYDETLGAGSHLEEIGPFSPENRRTQGLECVTGCELYSLTADGLYKLYYQNPKLGFHLVRLVVARLLRDAAVAPGRDRHGPAGADPRCYGRAAATHGRVRVPPCPPMNRLPA